MTRLRLDAQRLLLGGALLALALLVWAPIDHDDTYIYETTGRWIGQHHRIPRVDPFSWTYRGRTWQSNAWGWSLILWLAHEAGGQWVVALLKPALVVVAGLGSVWAARRFGARRGPAAVGAVLVLVLMFPWITDRPQMASFAFFPFTLAMAHLATRHGRLRLRWVAGLAGLLVVWVNVHSVALVGAAVVGALEAGVILDRLWWRRSGTWPPGWPVGPADAPSVGSLASLDGPAGEVGPSWPSWVSWFGGPVLVAAVAGLAMLVNPWGFGLITHAAQVRSLSASTISEWYPLLRSGPIMVIPIAVAVAVVVVTVAAGPRRRVELVLPVLATAVLTLDANRNAPFFLLAVAILVTPMIPASWTVLAGRRDLALVGVVAALVIGVVVAVPHAWSSGDPGPHIAGRSTDALPRGCKLRNDYRLGGYVIWRRPDVPVSADGRNDLYGLAGYAQNRWFEQPEEALAAPDTFRAQGVDCVLATPDSPIIAPLERAGWRVVGRDGSGVALVSGSAS